MFWTDALYSKLLVQRLKRFAPVMAEIIPLASQQSSLAESAERFGSDKGSVIEGDSRLGWPAHTYTFFYERHFRGKENSVQFVLECGIGTDNPELVSSMGERGSPGASLRLWRDFFPNAEVIGVDIDKGILFQEERIRTFELDQTDGQSTSELLQQLDLKFDLIIDDGLHTFDAGISFFESSFPFLAKGGLYVIEDVTETDALDFMKYFAKSPLIVELVRLRRGKSRIGDNQLLCIYGNR